MENNIEEQIPQSRVMIGRPRVYVKKRFVDESNVAEVLSEAVPIFDISCAQVTYLNEYYCGVQPILQRKKYVRKEICSRYVENRASEIVDFKTGYLMQEPIQYVWAEEGDEDVDKKGISMLNRFMRSESKHSKDVKLAKWLCKCGIGYRRIMADDSFDGGDAPKSSPFDIETLDPRTCFLIRSRSNGGKVVAGAFVGYGEDDSRLFTVYTDKYRFVVDEGGTLLESGSNGLGFIPLIEYELDDSRSGVFEKALHILDMINRVESNRIDSIESIVQAIYLFKNCDIDEDDFLGMLGLGALKVADSEGRKGDVSLLKNDLDQTQVQVAKSDLIEALYEVCGMPVRNTGGANDTGSAVYMRDGYAMAESRAKIQAASFIEPERLLIDRALRICEKAGCDLGITAMDVAIVMNRTNHDNIQSKAQTFSTLVQAGVHPLDAMAFASIAPDPTATFKRMLEWGDSASRVTDGGESPQDQPDGEATSDIKA